METINEKLEILFEEWNKDQKPFVKDGIMLKQECRNIDVDAEWQKLSRRVLFLLKDQPKRGEDNYPDTRWWIRCNPKTAYIQQRFIHKIANLFYGLSFITRNEPISFENLPVEKVKEHFNTVPFGFMECKKEPGGPYLKDNKLSECMLRDKSFIYREIDIINPNIIVCCGGPQYGFMMEKYGKDNLIGYGYGNDYWKNLSYCREKKLVILYAGHPSSRGKYSSYYDYYENAMHNFREFLQSEDGKDFLGE